MLLVVIGYARVFPSMAGPEGVSGVNRAAESRAVSQYVKPAQAPEAFVPPHLSKPDSVTISAEAREVASKPPVDTSLGGPGNPHLGTTLANGGRPEGQDPVAQEVVDNSLVALALSQGLGTNTH